MSEFNLKQISQKLRYLILASTTAAGSGHPTSCLSAVELMTALMFGGFYQKNDHLIFSKGHAAPLLYSLMALKGELTEAQMLTLRQFNSPLQGHPMPGLPGIEVATGSLGQGLSIGVGMALADKRLSQNTNQTYVLLGDGEVEEGSIWEAVNLASYYRLDNLVAIVDVNRLEQDGETILGHDLQTLSIRFSSFGWQTLRVENGHDFGQIEAALAVKTSHKPKVIVAKTIKGKGVTLFEDKKKWHGKALSKTEFGALNFEFNQTDKENLSLAKDAPISELLTKLDKLSHD